MDQDKHGDSTDDSDSDRSDGEKVKGMNLCTVMTLRENNEEEIGLSVGLQIRLENGRRRRWKELTPLQCSAEWQVRNP